MTANERDADLEAIRHTLNRVGTGGLLYSQVDALIREAYGYRASERAIQTRVKEVLNAPPETNMERGGVLTKPPAPLPTTTPPVSPPMFTRRVHDLKTWPGPFIALWRGEKFHELRRNDRGYVVGDVLVLREWDPALSTNGRVADDKYTARAICAQVTHITPGGSFGLPSELCIMSIREISRAFLHADGNLGPFNSEISRLQGAV